MLYISILTGLACILMGFVIAKYPNSIAGYNTMSPEEKEKVDINKVAKILRNGLYIGGSLTVIGGTIFTLLGMPLLATLSLCLSIMLSVAISIALSQKYDKTKRSLLKTVLVVTLIVLSSTYISIDIYRDSRPTEITLNTDNIEFNGAYGLNIALANIKSIELIDTMPKIKIRTGGLSIGPIKKGNFKLEGYDHCKLFISGNYSPYIHIKTTYNEDIFFNSHIEGQIQTIYHELQK